jgi:hypothetical protein
MRTATVLRKRMRGRGSVLSILTSSLKTAAEITRLGLDAQNVIALRTNKITAGGRAAHNEVLRMLVEKVSAAGEALAILANAGSGQKVIRRYRKHVKSNLRRLTR